jgi:hypothetical protein
MSHTEKHIWSGKVVKIKSHVKHMQIENFGGSDFRVEDWADRLFNKSWMYMDGNPACMIYAMRSGCTGIPTDDEVVYGKVGAFGHLLHVSELEEI